MKTILKSIAALAVLAISGTLISSVFTTNAEGGYFVDSALHQLKEAENKMVHLPKKGRVLHRRLVVRVRKPSFPSEYHVPGSR